MEFIARIIVRGLGLLALSLWFSGCASVSPTGGILTGTNSVRRVDCRETPEFQAWAERARKVGDEFYPKIVALLTEDAAKSPRQFDIVFKKTLKGDNRGIAAGKTIYLNASYFTRDTNSFSSYVSNPANFDKVLIHEMAHVSQREGFSIGMYSITRTLPDYWREGIADYGRYKVAGTNGWRCPEYGDEFPHYRSGYRCAGAFLLHVDATYGSNVVRQLAAAVRVGSYTDAFFARTTGKTLDELWSEFQKTPVYLPTAADTYKLHQALGYVFGRPPKDIEARATAYMKTTPGGRLSLGAAEFLYDLAAKDRLPGAPKANHSDKHFALSSDLSGALQQSTSDKFPATRKMYGHFTGETDRIYYLVSRPAQDRPWQLQRAWRENRDGLVLQESPLELKSSSVGERVNQSVGQVSGDEPPPN